MLIRTEKWVTITEAHPYHHYVSDERHRGGNAVVEKAFDPNCPLCRAERDQQQPQPVQAGKDDAA
jgi:hypothetical protein